LPGLPASFLIHRHKAFETARGAPGARHLSTSVSFDVLAQVLVKVDVAEFGEGVGACE
jgi:hypothetical protein